MLEEPKLCLHGICDVLYVPQTSFKIIICLIYGIEFIFSTIHHKEEVEIKPYVTMVIRFGMYLSIGHL